MTKVKPSNGNETKPDIFPWTYSDLTIFFIGCKILKCQFYSKREHKQVKGNKTTPEMCKSDSVFRYLQNGTLFK